LNKPFWIKPLFKISWDEIDAAGLLLFLVLKILDIGKKFFPKHADMSTQLLKS